MSRRRAYSDPTADQALRNIAEEAQREYEERHRRRSPDVIRDEENPVDDLAGYIEQISEVIRMTNVAVYPVSRTYTHQVTPSIKSLMLNSDVDQIILLTEMDQFPEHLPKCVKPLNVFNNRYFSRSSLNATRSGHAYLCEMRVALAEILYCDRVLSLDADALIVNEIGSEPWTMDLGDCHVAGVPETRISARLGKPYINAGVMMFDLDRIRLDNLATQMVDALNHYSYQWLEQDCINDYLRVKPLGSEWNACQFTEPCQLPKIRHFAYEQDWIHSDIYRKYDGMSWNVVEDKWKEWKGMKK